MTMKKDTRDFLLRLVTLCSDREDISEDVAKMVGSPEGAEYYLKEATEALNDIPVLCRCGNTMEPRATAPGAVSCPNPECDHHECTMIDDCGQLVRRSDLVVLDVDGRAMSADERRRVLAADWWVAEGHDGVILVKYEIIAGYGETSPLDCGVVLTKDTELWYIGRCLARWGPEDGWYHA